MTAPLLPERFDDDDLVLRRWTLDDAPALHDAVRSNLDHLRPWMPWIAAEPQTLEQRAALIEDWDRGWSEGGDVVLGIYLDGAVIGSTGLHRRRGPGVLEIGYWIDRRFTGRGLATRVARILTNGAFAVPGIERVEIVCDEANLASARVPEKIGFDHVGDLDVLMSAPSETGSHRLYRMTAEDWFASSGE